LDHGAINPQPPPQPLNTTNQGYHHLNANFVNYNHPSPAYAISANQQVDASYYSLNQHPNNLPMYINLNSDGLQVTSINSNSNNSNIPYLTVPLPQQQPTFNLVQSQLLPQQQQSPHIYVPVNSYMYQQQHHHQYAANLANKTQDSSKNPTPQLTFNKGNNRNYVPLYCGTCRTYGCQCFYSSTDVANTTNSQEVLPSTNNQQHHHHPHHQHHQQSANVNLYSNGHQNAAAIKANIEQQQQQYAAAAATAYYNYIQTSSQQQKQAFLDQQKSQIEQNRIQVLNQSLKDLNLNKLSSSPTSSSSSSSSSSTSSSSSVAASSSSSSTTNPTNNASGASSSNANQTEISNTNEINTKQLSNASLSVKNEATTTAVAASKNNIIYSQIPILVHQQQSHQLSSQLPLQYLPTNSTLGNLFSGLKFQFVMNWQ